jgi:hypothetical protein
MDFWDLDFCCFIFEYMAFGICLKRLGRFLVVCVHDNLNIVINQVVNF